MSEYEWQGEPVDVRFGNMIVTENKERPLWWYNYEVHTQGFYPKAVIPAIEVTYNDHVFYISNHCGIGVHKLKNGGSPQYTHYSLDGKFMPCTSKDEYILIERELDEAAYYARNEACKRWQKEHFPEEFKKSEALREHILKMRS